MKRGDERYADLAPGCKLTQELLALADQDMLLRPLPVVKQLGVPNLLTEPQLPAESHSGEPLKRWYAARVESVDDEALHIRMVECPNASPVREDLRVSAIKRDAFQGCCHNAEYSDLTRRRYSEIGEYGPKKIPLIKVFPMSDAS